MQQLDRIVELYLLLPAYPRKSTVTELHQRLIGRGPDFTVCRRTVERDLAFMMGSRHLAVETDEAKPAGWYRDPQRSMFIKQLFVNTPQAMKVSQRALADAGCLPTAARRTPATAEHAALR
ncbi:hypothetical protein U5801_15930 [Lamprobacter modestohalophilus]|uniref:hypothetical protein n=1 Tax=Lamprobacter modestohalophilus TaxID=1064514 RepID=UPI002ADECE49|nr:hypothetical protein [Lamprobacter modestohalophilus]MEA1051284.1 hypothetical protein [Lamprobacter modestohalophilus]